MGISIIENSPGSPRKNYRAGQVYKCFKCSLWYRWIGDNEMCKRCQIENKAKDQIQLFTTNQAVEANKE